MEIKSNKIIYLINVCLLCAFVFVNAPAAHAARKTSGTDENGNSWGYDKKTKTLTFSGNKAIEDAASMDGHSPEPSWYIWQDDTEHLVIEDGITGVGEGAFKDFVNLKTAQVSNSVTFIGNMAFDACFNLTDICLSEQITSIGNSAFSSCALETLKLPAKIKKMGDFSCCEKLKEIVIPDSVTQLGEFMFADCFSLERVVLPPNITRIRQSDFRNCKKLTKLKIPAKVTSISMSAFSGSGIRHLVLPQNVKILKKGFVIGGKVFSGNKKLRKITIKSRKIKKIAKGAFSGLGKSCVIELPKGKKKKYTKMLRKSGLSKKVKIK